MQNTIFYLHFLDLVWINKKSYAIMSWLTVIKWKWNICFKDDGRYVPNVLITILSPFPVCDLRIRLITRFVQT